MKIFYTHTSQGVTALVSDSVFWDGWKIGLIRRAFGSIAVTDLSISESIAHLKTRPVFTFAAKERFDSQPWLTGDMALHAKLVDHIREMGGQVSDVFEFYVPFSNGYEAIIDNNVKTWVKELSHVTTCEEFESTFGIGILELMNKKVAAAA